jgi:hypothetical protein
MPQFYQWLLDMIHARQCSAIDCNNDPQLYWISAGSDQHTHFHGTIRAVRSNAILYPHPGVNTPGYLRQVAARPVFFIPPTRIPYMLRPWL